MSGERAWLELAIACASRGMPTATMVRSARMARFGGKSQSTTASWHMHGHTHILPGFVLLGEQLLEDGRPELGLAMIGRTERTFDWLYDAQRNPDAASRSHPSLSHLDSYCDRAQQIYCGQVGTSVFRPSPEYLRRVRSCLEERVAKGPLGSVVWHDRSGCGNDAALDGRK